MNNIKKSPKFSNGITLIALVITIIVLLILAGISISMLSGDNGILQKATLSKEKNKRAQIVENAQIDILGQQSENRGTNITKGQLATILNKYFKPTETSAIPDEVSSEYGHDLELTTIDEMYKINLSKIYNGKIANDVADSTDYSEKLKIYFNSPESRDEMGDFIDNDTVVVKASDLHWLIEDDISYLLYKGFVYKTDYDYLGSVCSYVTKIDTDFDLNRFGEYILEEDVTVFVDNEKNIYQNSNATSLSGLSIGGYMVVTEDTQFFYEGTNGEEILFTGYAVKEYDEENARSILRYYDMSGNEIDGVYYES